MEVSEAPGSFDIQSY